MSSMIERAFAAHAKLKSRIHTMRFPIKTRAGRFAMACVYFTIPCVCGYGLMQWTNGVRDRNLGAPGRREHLVRMRDLADGPSK